MWVIDNNGDAVNLDKATYIYWREENEKFEVKVEMADELSSVATLKTFTTAEEAKKYLADLVGKLNGGK